ncbi:alpha/beta fold hydrolase [Streptomyces sp. NPDC008150]|uniref:alpha/beta hydrolase family protein n=1 Tax=Streptomyces sp. NPDC008150 TaxID=3364816 RepID=UPI0036F0F29D
MSSTSPPPAAAERPRAGTVRRVQEALLGLDRPVEARVSPDGRTVAVTVAGPACTDVILVPADGSATGRAASAANQPPHAGSSAASADSAQPVHRHRPRWLPDSRTLLLVTEAPPERPGATALPALTAWDTATGARRTLARVPGAVEDLLVADDGTEVLLLVADDGTERDGMNLGLPVRLGPAPDPETFRPGAGRRRLLHGELPLPEALFATGGQVRAELRDAGPTGLTVWNCAWRGGSTAVATVSEETLPAGYYRARFARLGLHDGSAGTLYESEGQLAAPALSADGRRAAVVEGISIVAGRPVVVDLADPAAGPAVPTPAEDVTWLRFVAGCPDRLLTAGWCGTGSRVTEVRLGANLPGGADVTVRGRSGAVLGGPTFQPALTLSADGSLAASVLDGPGLPPQAVVATTAGPDAWAWRPVTALNGTTGNGTWGDEADAGTAPGLAELARVRTRETSWTSADGSPVHGLLLDAPGVPVPGGDPGDDGASAHAPRPLAVVVHGGPSWLWSAHHAPADVLGLAPALAAAGWLVLLPNPRGSSGYGLDHARAVVGTFGERDLDDLLTGVAALTSAGEAAADRAAVLGHSYGGYLAAVAAARTTVFRAAVVVSAPTDWLSFAHTSVIGGGYELTYRIGDAATPEGRAQLLARSPVFADAGSPVPTLLLHGEHDRVTPVSQAQELYRSLARRGTTPVELHVYPGEGHEFTDPAHLLDAAARAEAWLDRHVVAGPRADPSGPEGPDGRPAPEPGPAATVPGGRPPIRASGTTGETP